MKNTFYKVLILVFVLSLLVSCGGKEQTIKVTGTTFNGKVTNYSGNKKWVEASGNILTKITVDNNGSIYGITNYGNIVLIDKTDSWIQLSGENKFRRLSAGNGKICGIASDGLVYLYDTDSQEWDAIYDSKVSNIDLDTDGSIWIIDQDGVILSNTFNIETNKYGKWVSLNSPDELLIDIAGDTSGTVWGVGENGTVYNYGNGAGDSNEEVKKWKIVGGENLRAIDVDSDGTVWGINSDGNAVRYITDPADKDKMIWEKFEVQLSEIAASGIRSM